MLLPILLQSSSPSFLPDDAWARISADVALARSSTTIDFIRDDADAAEGEYTLRLTVHDPAGLTTNRWATSRTCRGVQEAVEALGSVPFPSVQMPRDATEIVMDGVAYSVRFSARYGSQLGGPLELRSNIGTPLAAFVDRMIATVQPCWSSYRLLPKPER